MVLFIGVGLRKNAGPSGLTDQWMKAQILAMSTGSDARAAFIQMFTCSLTLLRMRVASFDFFSLSHLFACDRVSKFNTDIRISLHTSLTIVSLTCNTQSIFGKARLKTS